ERDHPPAPEPQHSDTRMRLPRGPTATARRGGASCDHPQCEPEVSNTKSLLTTFPSPYAMASTAWYLPGGSAPLNFTESVSCCMGRKRLTSPSTLPTSSLLALKTARYGCANKCTLLWF